MININTLKKNLHEIAAKSQTGAGITPDTFNLWIPFAVYYVIRRILGLPEEYKPQIPMTQMGYEKTQMMTEYMDAIKISNVSMTVNKYGKCNLPGDYLYISDLYSYCQQSGTVITDDILSDPDVGMITSNWNTDPSHCEPCGEGGEMTVPIVSTEQATTMKTLRMRTPIEVVDSKTYTSRQQHSIRIPTLEYPIAVFAGKKVLEVSPQDVGRAFITYIQRPATPFWAYTIDAATLQPVYDAALSTNIDLPEELTDMVTANMLTRLGYSVRETELQQIGKTINATGS